MHTERIKPERRGKNSSKVTTATVRLAPAWRGGEGQNRKKAAETQIKAPPGKPPTADPGNGITRY